jgi:tetratricopeptide (TPR) repeat protein
MADPTRIFVSHSHEDDRWCRAFIAALRKAGADIWYDEHNLGYGRLMDEIERELHFRDVFVVVLSPAAVASPWVRREVNAAIQLHDKQPERILLPVIAETCEVPLLWNEYKRVCGPGDTGLPSEVAAGRVLSALGVSLNPAIPPQPAPATGESMSPPGNTGSLEEQLREYDRVLVFNSDDVDTLERKGDVLRELRRPGDALVTYEHALALQPDRANLWWAKGTVLSHLRQYGPALAAFERAIALEPEYTDAWYGKMWALIRLGHREEAQVVYERAKSLSEHRNTSNQ